MAGTAAFSPPSRGSPAGRVRRRLSIGAGRRGTPARRMIPNPARPACRLDHEVGGHRWSLVTANLEALLTALYVLIDDHVIFPPARAGRRSCRTPSGRAWRWPRRCWTPGRNITGCGCATDGWGTCSPSCPIRPATTSGSRRSRRCRRRRGTAWPPRAVHRSCARAPGRADQSRPAAPPASPARAGRVIIGIEQGGPVDVGGRCPAWETGAVVFIADDLGAWHLDPVRSGGRRSG
jgi:hypothetical protein